MRLISAASGVSMYRNAAQFYQMARTYRLTSALPCIPVEYQDYVQTLTQTLIVQLSISQSGG